MRTKNGLVFLVLALVRLYHDTHSKVKAVGVVGLLATGLLMFAAETGVPLDVDTSEVISGGAVALATVIAGWLKRENVWG